MEPTTPRVLLCRCVDYRSATTAAQLLFRWVHLYTATGVTNVRLRQELHLDQTVRRSFAAGILRHEGVVVRQKTRLPGAGVFAEPGRSAEAALRVVVVLLRHHPLLPLQLLGLERLDLGRPHFVKVPPQLRDFEIGLLELPLVPGHQSDTYESRSLKSRHKDCIASGCGSVGRVVASDTRDPQFKSYHRQNFIYPIVNQLYNRKDKNSEKEAQNGPSLKKSL